MERFCIGQRWISEMEPELGLGIVTEINGRRVHIHFPASECIRQYAIQTAPIKRVRFQVGDKVKGLNGEDFKVIRVVEKDRLIVYHGVDFELAESELCSSISFTTPENRLMGGMVDKNAIFNLRYETLRALSLIRKSAIRGFIGGRIDLIPHQIYIAHEVARRHRPRVLLADEVGLGKTIEACLIIHSLLIHGRINRVLILVPESLVHQWFVELMRRFNLVFRIFDEPYCHSIEAVHPEVNPFLEDQLGLCDIHFLVNNDIRKQQAKAGDWDMLVVDEAHHLTEGSSAYRLIEELGGKIPGLMLLTATPEQLGKRSHFARLRLLDPARYYDFDAYSLEAEKYQRVVTIVNNLLDGSPLNRLDGEYLGEISSSETNDDKKRIQSAVSGNRTACQQLIDTLLDRHGPGRVIFRNTRSSMTGFPKRVVRLIRLPGSDENIESITKAFKAEEGDPEKKISYHLKEDPRIFWLAELLRKQKNKKFLLICRSMFKAKAIDEALRERIKLKAALFHEDMSLIQRDRNAAWFAVKDGAQILICSEIGSEGRNFQFAHHLVLFDLPLDPELLEQRIGRLDRIGQTQTITIDVPYVPDTPLEVLVKWYHEGLNAFEMNVPGAYQIFEALGQRIKDIALSYTRSKDTVLPQFEKLLEKTREVRDDLAEHLRRGRDRLLELNSYRPLETEGLLSETRACDNDGSLDNTLFNIFHHFGIRTEETGNRTFRVNFDLLTDQAFPIPMFSEEGKTVTFDRKRALSHEEIEFLTWDHPMVIGAMDLIFGSELGNSGFALWLDPASREILLEAVFVLECVAPVTLQVDRFLPPTPIRIVVNHRLEDCSETYTIESFSKDLRDSPSSKILNDIEGIKILLPKMVKRSQQLADVLTHEIIEMSLSEMGSNLGKEVERLRYLKAINPNVRVEEISLAEQEMDTLHNAIATSRLRLDALRLIWKGPSEKLSFS